MPVDVILPRGTSRLFSRSGYPHARVERLAEDRDTVAALAHALFFAPGRSILQTQQEDLSLGGLVALSLACHHQLPGVHEALVAALQGDPDDVDALLGDWVTELAARHLVRSFEGQAEPLLGLLRDAGALVWARDQAATALTHLRLEGHLENVPLREIYEEVAQNRLGTDSPEVLLESLIRDASVLESQRVPWARSAMVALGHQADPDLRLAFSEVDQPTLRSDHRDHLLRTYRWTGPHQYQGWHAWTLWQQENSSRRGGKRRKR